MSVLQDYYNTDDDAYSSPGSTYLYGQNFIADSSYTLKSIKFKGYRHNTGVTITIQVYEADANHKPDSLISSGTMATDGMTSSAPGAWYEVEMSSCDIVEGTEYIVVIRTNSDYVNWRRDSNGGFAEAGYVYSANGGASWDYYTYYDYMFEVYSENSFDSDDTFEYFDKLNDESDQAFMFFTASGNYTIKSVRIRGANTWMGGESISHATLNVEIYEGANLQCSGTISTAAFPEDTNEEMTLGDTAWVEVDLGEGAEIHQDDNCTILCYLTNVYDPPPLPPWPVELNVAVSFFETFGVLSEEETPEKPTNPTPADDATDVDFSDLTLSWENGGGADTFDVYIGDAADNLTLISSAQAGTSKVLSAAQRQLFTSHCYWRVDATNDQGTTTGDVWDFVVAGPGKAQNPTPSDNKEGVYIKGVDRLRVLRWEAPS